MGFRKNVWATVWEIGQDHKGYPRIRISTSYKRKDGTFQQDFSGFCRLFGTAAKKLPELQVKDRIQLGEVETQSFYDKKKKKDHLVYKIYDFEKVTRQ